MKNQIYGFALGKTRTSKILYSLSKVDHCYLLFKNNLGHYLSVVLRGRPKYLLGLGTYSGIDQEKIRIETKCTNQFRNKLVDENRLQQMQITPFIKENQYMKIANKLGNSYCNFFSWKIMRFIKQHNLETQYTFLHIPNKFDWRLAVTSIDEELGRLVTSTLRSDFED